MEAIQREQKRCGYCGRYYKPDPRTRKTQKSCAQAACRAKRKMESQRKWTEANPGYFQGRYEKVKQWRERHPITSVSGEKGSVRYKTRYPLRSQSGEWFS